MKIGSDSIIKFTERNTLKQKDLYKGLMKIINSYGFKEIKKENLLNKCLFKRDNAFYIFAGVEYFNDVFKQQMEIDYIELKEIYG